MKTSSAKAKGRRLCAELREALLKIGRWHNILPEDIVVTPSGVTGEDLYLSPHARKLFNFAIECKNQENLNVWKAFEQAQSHAKGGDKIPLLAFKRNKSKLMVCLELEHFLKLLWPDTSPT